MNTVTNSAPTRKSPTAFYGWLHEQHGVFLQVHDGVAFRDDETHTWQPVDLPTLTTWALLNGRVDLADMQQLLDGDRVRRCSQTLAPVVGSRN